MLNVIVNRREFLKRIQIVENALLDDKTNSSNSGILVETTNNKIVLKGLGDGLFIKAELECEVKEKGEFIIRHKLMEEFLKQLDQETIEIKEKAGKINISSGKSDSDFSIYEYEKRNEPKVSEIGSEYEFNKEDILNDIEKVKFAASLNVEKISVNCIRLELEDKLLKLVSSDSHRLIYLNRSFENEEAESLGISLPLRAVNGLIKIMKQLEEEKVKFKTDGSRAEFKFKDVEILTKLVEIQYPPYKSLINNVKKNKKALINVKEFISVLNRISVFVKDNTDKRYVAIFEFKDNKLEIQGRNDLATSTEQINTIYEGEQLRIALNVKYILDYLQTIQSNKMLEIKMYDQRQPVLMNVEDDDTSIYLIAPTQA